MTVLLSKTHCYNPDICGHFGMDINKFTVIIESSVSPFIFFLYRWCKNGGTAAKGKSKGEPKQHENFKVQEFKTETFLLFIQHLQLNATS